MEMLVGRFNNLIRVLILISLTLTPCLALSSQNLQTLVHSSQSPLRVVVLEYSFIDALAVIGISPVGVADDSNPQRVIPQVRQLVEPWTSVGMRSQPSLEVIAKLQPDLIIGDVQRHKISFKDLSSIAPTILLKSRGETYQEGLKAAHEIGKALGKEQQMTQRIKQHEQIMLRHKNQLSDIGTVQFANVNDRGMWMHGPKSYTGSLLEYLGLQPALPDLTDSHTMEANLEVLLRVNPDWLFFSKRKPLTVLDEWEKSPLYPLLKVYKNGNAIQVSPELWSLNRGMLASESIAKQLTQIIVTR